MRRFFRFLFRHDYVAGAAPYWHGTMMNSMKCSRCGHETPYFDILNQALFSHYYRQTGCPGAVTKPAAEAVASRVEDPRD